MPLFKLQHKDVTSAIIEFDSNYKNPFIKEIINERHLPLCVQGNSENIRLWWNKRAVPSSRKDIDIVMDELDIHDRNEFLIRNLALSVTDSYWLCPIDKNYQWNEVSFHTNAFPDFSVSTLDSNEIASQDLPGMSTLTPASSLGGELEKKWIRKDNSLYLVKGNMPGHSYQQSLNEVFASKLHEKQNFENYVSYELLKLKKGRKGCISRCFTTDDIEYVPAWEIMAKYGYGKDSSFFSQYLNNASKEGIDSKEHEKFLDYMFLSDFIITNVDRHLGNFGLLRDSDSSELIGPAPIFDSGNSMFYVDLAYMDYHDILNVQIRSLYSSEQKTMERITDLNLVDITKLPSTDEVRKLYSEDPVLESLIESLVNGYSFKVSMFEMMKAGKKFSQIKRELISYFGSLPNKDKDDLSNIRHLL